MKFKQNLLVALILIVLGSSVMASDYTPCSTSMEKSKKHKLFVQELKVCPQKFDWNGHEVDVFECWVEEYFSGHKQLCVRFKVDNSLIAEHRISNETHENLQFSGHSKPKHIEGKYMFLTPKQATHLLKGKAYGSIIHYINLDSLNREKFSFDVYSTNYRTRQESFLVKLEISS